MFKRSFLVVSIFIAIILTLGFVSASDDLNTTDVLNTESQTVENNLNLENDIDSTLNIENNNENDKISLDENNNIKSANNENKISSDISDNAKLKASNTKTFEDLQRYINSAKKGDTVKISSNYIGTGKAIKIDKSITIQGTGKTPTLDAKKLSRIFYITGNAKVTLKNIKLINGLEKERKGGAIYTSASNLNIYKCSFKSNSAYSAGDIYIAKGKCIVKQTTFNGSYYYQNDPEQYMADGYDFPTAYSSIINKGIASFYKCSFISSKHAIYSNNKTVFNKCTFKDISYTALTLKGTNSIKNCKFTKNSGEKYEFSSYHIVDIKKGKTSIINSIFAKNTAYVIKIHKAATCKLINSKFSGNYGRADAEYYLPHQTIKKSGKLFITKNKKTTKYNNDKTLYFGDSLKTIEYASPNKFSISKNFKQTVNVRYYGGYYCNSKAVLKVFTGNKYKTFKADKTKTGLFKFKINKITTGTHKIKFVLRISYELGNEYYVREGTLKVY